MLLSLKFLLIRYHMIPSSVVKWAFHNPEKEFKLSSRYDVNLMVRPCVVQDTYKHYSTSTGTHAKDEIM